MTKEITADDRRESCELIYKECYALYQKFNAMSMADNRSRKILDQYVEEMYIQLMGLNEDFDEYLDCDGDLEYLLGAAIETGEWFTWAKKVINLLKSQPHLRFC